MNYTNPVIRKFQKCGVYLSFIYNMWVADDIWGANICNY